MKSGRPPVSRQSAAVQAPGPWPLDRLGLLDQAGHDPGLGLGDRTAFRDLDDVAQVVLALLVVRVVLARLRDDLAVELVLGATLDQDRDGLGALVAHHAADEGAGVLFSGLSGSHLAAPFFFSARMVLARAMSRRVLPRVEVLLSCWVPFCMRRPKWAFSRSETSFSSAAVSLARSSDA